VKTTLTPTDWAAAGAPPVGPQGVVLPRQPVHTVYGGAHLFRADTVAKMGVVALGLLDRFAPDGASLADALGLALPKERADGLRARVVDKLRREPIEDYRIDFEDGFGLRSDDEESREAERSATELARAERSRTAPPQVGLRIKPLVGSTARRAAETLDRFLTTLVRELGGLPPGFVVTLPKVESESEVNRLADLLDRLEAGLELRRGVLRVELMVESTRALVDTEGRLALPRLVAAGRGRVVGAHFGTYDYTASCGVVAAHQSMGHPACGFALQVMQACLAHTGVLLSDGATNTLPIPPHRAPKSASEEAENAVRVRGAWSVHADNIRRSLALGYYQSWDLHPGQLPVRYAVFYDFFERHRGPTAERLVRFLAEATRATVSGQTFDDAATGQGLLNFFLRAWSSGAMTTDELERATGHRAEDLARRSFAALVAAQAREPGDPRG
jgi:citrate lyase beta subunit